MIFEEQKNQQADTIGDLKAELSEMDYLATNVHGFSPLRKLILKWGRFKLSKRIEKAVELYKQLKVIAALPPEELMDRALQKMAIEQVNAGENKEKRNYAADAVIGVGMLIMAYQLYNPRPNAVSSFWSGVAVGSVGIVARFANGILSEYAKDRLEEKHRKMTSQLLVNFAGRPSI